MRLRVLGLAIFVWGAFASEVHAERIGIFIGSFDPPHLGHAAIVLRSLEAKLVDRVLVVPQDLTVHKPFRSRTAIRLEMLKILFAGDSRVIIPSLDWGFPLFRSSIHRFSKDTEWILMAGDDVLENPVQALAAELFVDPDAWIWFPRNQISVSQGSFRGKPLSTVERTELEKSISSRKLRIQIRRRANPRELEPLLGPALTSFVLSEDSPYKNPKNWPERFRLCKEGITSLLTRLRR